MQKLDSPSGSTDKTDETRRPDTGGRLSSVSSVPSGQSFSKSPDSGASSDSPSGSTDKTDETRDWAAAAVRVLALGSRRAPARSADSQPPESVTRAMSGGVSLVRIRSIGSSEFGPPSQTARRFQPDSLAPTLQSWPCAPRWRSFAKQKARRSGPLSARSVIPSGHEFANSLGNFPA
jgi:hypothetical protein